jgi:acetolactate synthase-1/2/3 large subunit
MVKMLENVGVKRIFGYPGAAICPLFREIGASAIDFTLVRHETAAGLAANGYARVSGGVGVCAATSGPGALNLLPAFACAYADSIPIVAISGQVKMPDVGTDAFQEADVTGAAEPFVKYSFLVKDPETIPQVIKEAFYLARSGRPGPVLIDIPTDVLQAECPFDENMCSGEIHLRSYNPTVEGNVFQIKKAAEALMSAKKPLVVAGGGIFLSGARETLSAFVREYNIPVCTTMMGIGVLPSADKLGLGMIGLFGNTQANAALREADLLLFIGARADERAIPNPSDFTGREIIHVDIDPAELGKNIVPAVPIVCDCKFFLEKLGTLLSKKSDTWITRRPVENFTPAGAFINKLTARTPDSIIVADVGNNQITAAMSSVIDNGRFITSGGMGTMGYALPAAIGAKTAKSHTEVICVCGDGGFQMSMTELATVREQHLPLKIVILNDSSLGMVRDLICNYKESSWNASAFGTDLSGGNPDFAAVARCYGIESERVTDFSEKAIDRLLTSPEAYLIDLVI